PSRPRDRRSRTAQRPALPLPPVTMMRMPRTVAQPPRGVTRARARALRGGRAPSPGPVATLVSTPPDGPSWPRPDGRRHRDTRRPVAGSAPDQTAPMEQPVGVAGRPLVPSWLNRLAEVGWRILVTLALVHVLTSTAA